MTRTILVLAANPKNTPLLRLDEEIREIDNGLERAKKRNEFILKAKLAARPVDVRRAMLDYKPNIVHFCGHGAGDEGIAFEDENGNVKLVSADTLEGFFDLFSETVECVILNACYSEVQAQAISKHVATVIGMKKAIGDKAAVQFSVAFYDALGAGETIRFAYKLACNAIQWAGIPEHLTPILNSKSSPEESNREEIAVVDPMKVAVTKSHLMRVSAENTTPISDAQLLDFINEYFSTNEISIMCFNLAEELRQAKKLPLSSDLGIDTFSSMNLPKKTIVQEMVSYFRRRNWTSFLLRTVKSERPDLFRDTFEE